MKLLSLLIYFFASLMFFSISLLATDINWVVMSDLKDEQRKQFLAEKNFERLYRLVNDKALILEDYFFAIKDMEGFGNSFTYLGNVESEFLRYIQEDEANGNSRVVLFPGCGYGRSVLDALSKTKNTAMIANDLSKTAIKKLSEAQKHWFPEAEDRLILNHDSIFDFIKTLDNESVDTIFSANLIHFFNPAEIEEFFYQLNRVLKQNGKVFLIWEGFAPDREYQNLSQSFQIFQKTISKLYECQNPYPTYFSQETLPKDLEALDNSELEGPHNFITLSEVIDVSLVHGFRCERQRLFRPITSRGNVNIHCELIGMSVPKQLFFMSREEPIDEDQKLDCFPGHHLVFIKTKNDVDIERSYSQKFIDNSWQKHIDDHLCDYCRIFVEKPKKCGACKMVKYCGGKCQKDAWPQHKDSCSFKKK